MTVDNPTIMTDAATALTALHDATTALAEAALPLARAIDAHGAVAAAYHGDGGRALVVGQIRSCVASCYEVAAHVLTIEHLLDERHVAALATLRPITTANSLTVVSPRDAWRRAVESLAYGSSYGSAALLVLRAERDPVAEDLAAVLVAAEEVAIGLTNVEPILVTGVDPASVGAPVVLPSESAHERRRPRWGPGAG